MMRTAISPLPRSMASKVLGSITKSCESESTVAVAERGLLVMIDISPKNSPGPSVLNCFSTSRTVLEIATSPERITNISRPSSPSRKSTEPLAKALP